MEERVNKASYEELLNGKQKIKHRMMELNAISTVSDTDAYKSRKVIDLHWDNVMKEMVILLIQILFTIRL